MGLIEGGERRLGVGLLMALWTALAFRRCLGMSRVWGCDALGMQWGVVRCGGRGYDAVGWGMMA